ncbi:unnamed protein product [Sphagnum balticum]
MAALDPPLLSLLAASRIATDIIRVCGPSSDPNALRRKSKLSSYFRQIRDSSMMEFSNWLGSWLPTVVATGALASAPESMRRSKRSEEGAAETFAALAEHSWSAW